MRASHISGFVPFVQRNGTTSAGCAWRPCHFLVLTQGWHRSTAALESFHQSIFCVVKVGVLLCFIYHYIYIYFFELYHTVYVQNLMEIEVHFAAFVFASLRFFFGFQFSSSLLVGVLCFSASFLLLYFFCFLLFLFFLLSSAFFSALSVSALFSSFRFDSPLTTTQQKQKPQQKQQ